MDRKELLLVNAAKIITEEGIAKLTMSYLAMQSGITKGGVLYHFDSKSQLLYEMNRMAIEKFDQLLISYEGKLEGVATFTRAYAHATLHYIKEAYQPYFQAVFMSYLEDEKSLQLWEETMRKWDEKFQEETGDPAKNLQCRLMCDGIWFTQMYSNLPIDQLEQTVLNFCEKLEEA